MQNYESIRILGEGSFGKVYLMRHKATRKLVCTKVIKIKNVPKKEREACRMEIKLLQKLQHPNIVGYKEDFYSRNRESLCIVMNYCDGGDLTAKIKSARRRLFPEDTILNWFVQMALGLHYMHENRVLHRDLKSQNIFLLGNGRLVLGDLGISKVLEGTMDFAQTCIGTPYYMSPEIFKNKPYNHKSDVWALGCVLYEMTTLKHAFDANSLNGLACKIIRGQYPPIHRQYSRHLNGLIKTMLNINPVDRPSLRDILRAPFIRKHVVRLLRDMVERAPSKLGEGTMGVKAAVMGAAGGARSLMGEYGPEVENLRRQLVAIDLGSVISRALEPPSVDVVRPDSPTSVRRLAKEQALALQREEERKKSVEAALEKLRMEKEERARQQQWRYRGGRKPPVPRRAESKPSGRGGAGSVRPPVSVAGVAASAANRRSKAAARRRVEPGGAGAVGGSDASRRAAAEAERRRAEEASAKEEGERRRVRNLELWEEAQKEREAERAKKKEEARRKRREREEEWGREKERVERERRAKELEQQQQEAAVAAAEAAAEREREREREIRRRTEDAKAEQPHVQVPSLASRRSRSNANGHSGTNDSNGSASTGSKPRRRSFNQPAAMGGDEGGYSGLGVAKPLVRDPFSNLPPRGGAQAVGGPANAGGGNSSSRGRASSGSGSYGAGGADVGAGSPPFDEAALVGLSAKDRVLARKQQKALEEERARREQLEAAERLNRAARAAASERHKAQYRPSDDPHGSGALSQRDDTSGNGAAGGGGVAGGPVHPPFQAMESDDQLMLAEAKRSGNEGADRAAGDGRELSEAKARAMLGRLDSQDSQMSMDDLKGELPDSRYAKPERDGLVRRATFSSDEDGDDDLGSEGAGEEDDGDAPEDGDVSVGGPGDNSWEGDQAEDDMDLEERENELQEELRQATTRCDDLRATLHETRTLMGPGALLGVGAAVGKRSMVMAAPPPLVTEEDSEEESDDIGGFAEEEEDDEDDDEEEVGEGVIAPEPALGDEGAVMKTPKKKRVLEQELVDAPSPHTGRLSDRIRVLRERCVAGLGPDTFRNAYNYLKDEQTAAADNDNVVTESGGERFEGVEDEDERIHRGLAAIIGADKLHFWGIIDQLIFIEETHFG